MDVKPKSPEKDVTSQEEAVLLKVESLKVVYPVRKKTFVAVDGVDLTVREGEIHGLVGESGAGKSTVGSAIMGLLDPPGQISSGKVFLKGQRLDELSAPEMRLIRGRRIGMIFQDPQTSLNPLMTIKKQLIQTIRTHLPLDEKAAHKRALELLEAVGIEDAQQRINAYPHQFSGGMRQRVVIALALCADPDLLIADEPTTALDVSIQAQILDLIKKLCRERQLGVILVTHDMGVIAEIADSLSVMYKGRVVETGKTSDVLGNPQHLYTRSLIAAVPRMGVKVGRFPLVSYSEDDDKNPISERKAAHMKEDVAQKESLSSSKNWLKNISDRHEGGRLNENGSLVQVKDLGLRFRTKNAILKRNRAYFSAVQEENFSIYPGEIFGIVGESGSGKSSIARLITGLYRPYKGEVWVAGECVSADRMSQQAQAALRSVQMIFQDPYASLNPRMTVESIIAEPLLFYGLVQKKSEAVRVVQELLEQVELPQQAAQKYPHEFSGGQRQRISIARALATQPRFLICDEPTSALDVSIQAQILNLLKELNERLDLTMMFISHDLPVIRQMCDRVAVMKKGQILEIEKGEILFQTPQHSYTKDLLSFVPQTDSLASFDQLGS